MQTDKRTKTQQWTGYSLDYMKHNLHNCGVKLDITHSP